MAKGTYDDPILVDGLFTKTINGVKKKSLNSKQGQVLIHLILLKRVVIL